MSKKTGYAEIATHYRTLIADGTLAPGNDMPSMRDVCEQFGVSITTANRAFRLLKSEGLTLANPGVGTVVAERPDVVVTAAARLDRISRTGNRYGAGETSTKHFAGLRSCGDPGIADLLGVDLGDEIVFRRRVFVRGGKSNAIGLSHIRVRALIDVPELLQAQPFDRFWQEIYTERTGRTVTRSPERRTARIATNEELEEFGITADAEISYAVLVLVNVFHDEKGPLEVWEDVYAPGHWQVDGQ
jgi:GntR family transcriptional regulator